LHDVTLSALDGVAGPRRIVLALVTCLTVLSLWLPDLVLK
jgi:hypothetical protein